MTNERQDEIQNYLFDGGETPVKELADAIGASLATVRRDLTEMEKSGLIERLHGSARIASAARQEAAFGNRETTNLAAKRAIANAAFSQVRPGAMIFLDAGTTVLQLARRIMLAGVPVTLVTNGLVVARELAQAPAITLIVLGGKLRAENMSTTGPGAMAMLDTLWFDHLFLGASAISDDGWLSSFDSDEAQLNEHMAKRAAAVSVLADQSKYSTRAAYSVLQLNRRHTLISDAAPTGDLGGYLAETGMQIMVAERG